MTRGFPGVEFLNQREGPFNAPQRIRENAASLPPTGMPTVQLDRAAPLVPIYDPRSRASMVSLAVNLPTIAVGVQSLLFLSQTNAQRNILGFRNASAGTQNLYIDFATDASAASWLKLTPGQLMLFDSVVPQDDIYGISDAAGGLLAYVYSTINLGS